MSSYIYGRYVLSATEEAALRRAREEQLRREAEERKKRALLDEIRSIKEKYRYSDDIFSEASRSAKELAALFGTDDGWKELKEQFESTQRELERAVSKATMEMTSDVLQTIKEQCNSISARSVSLKRSLEKKAGTVEESFRAKSGEKIADAFQRDISFHVESRADKRKREQEEAENACAEENLKRLFSLKNLEVSAELEEKITASIAAVADVLCDAKTYREIGVIPLEKECREYLEKQSRYKERYAELYPDYQALCEYLGEEAEQFTATKVCMEQLEKETERLGELAAQADRNAYISRNIDEVMEELGYPVIGHREVQKKSGKRYSAELFRFEDGTAVNVTRTPDGSVSMEIGALDTEDRTPGEHEAEELCPVMEHFCDRYKEIEKKLAERGILIGGEGKVLPPTREYAQVINASEYETIETAGETERKKQHSAVKNNKTMRID